MKKPIFQHVLDEVVKAGVKEFCLCPGSRNSPLINCIMQSSGLKTYTWYEERSAAFFALGRARSSGLPVAIITTSGTAAGELLPAAMEAHYTGVPIVLITADRPRRFRGTGAPQTAEQQGLFGVYAHFDQDLEGDEECQITRWDYTGPAHLNICIEDPLSYPAHYKDLSSNMMQLSMVPAPLKANSKDLDTFFKNSDKPLVIVSALSKKEQESMIAFLLAMNAPIYCEASSGLREEPRLKNLQIRNEAFIWNLSKQSNYPIDGVLRIGSVPVTRLWRDLEDRPDEIAQCSLSGVPFSGLSWGSHIQCELNNFLSSYSILNMWKCRHFDAFKQADREKSLGLMQLFKKYPAAEPSLFHTLSKQIPPHSLVYLGNSLPVREWDLAADENPKNLEVLASRGLNGIDGQLSTFFGLCEKERENWAIVGDLTALYDFAALWILNSLTHMKIRIVVINNGGGKIFARMYQDPIFQNLHHFNFEHFANAWKIPYQCFMGTVPTEPLPDHVFIEIVPDSIATESFWKAYNGIK